MISDEVKGLYKIIPLKPFRKTPGVMFDIVPMEMFPRIDGIDRVIHEGGAVSPGSVGDVIRPWYMHPFQEDHLMVLQGTRYTELYTSDHGKIEVFDVSPGYIKKNGEIIFDGPAILSWPSNVFHRIKSDDRTGSISVNLAKRHEGFDIKTNFSIYSLDIGNGAYEVIREGYLDQNS
jgi:hypothetical protein